jgi:hypothetical protein
LGDVATADDKALDDLPIRNVTKVRYTLYSFVAA